MYFGVIIIYKPHLKTLSFSGQSDNVKTHSTWALLKDALLLTLSCYFLGAFQQSIVDVFSTRYLRFDHTEILRVRQGLCLHCVRFGCCRHQVWRVFGTVNALREALVSQALKDTKDKSAELQCTMRMRVYTHFLYIFTIIYFYIWHSDSFSL